MNKLNIISILFVFLISLATAEAYYVSISPNPANTANTLTCNTDAPSPYFYWYDTANLGSVIAQTNALPDYLTTRGQTYRCIVKRYLGTQGLVVVGQDDRYISNANPVITLFDIDNATVGVPIQFNSTATDIDGDALTYSWDVDGNSVTDYVAQNPTHTYTSAGTYLVTLTVTDGQGGSAQASGNVFVSPASVSNVTITLNSTQDNANMTNLGNITFNLLSYVLPSTISSAPGFYGINYTPIAGFAFINWTATPGLFVTNVTSQSTTINVTSNGTLTAVYADIQPPAITILDPINQTYNVSTVLINITAADNVAVSQIWYNIDGVANITYAAPVNSSALPNGPHTLTAYANDTSNNINWTSVGFTINVTVPPTLYNVTLNSLENNSATADLGTTGFNGVTYPLNNSVLMGSGVYPLNFTTSAGYNLSYWNTSGLVTVANASSIITTANVSGNGTITAVYFNNSVINQTNQTINYSVFLTSQEYTSATMWLGQTVFNGTTYTLPYLASVPAATYNISYIAAANYTFDHWNTTGLITVANQYAISTNATVIGNGTIVAVYNYTFAPANQPPNVTLIFPTNGTILTSNNASLTFHVFDDQSLILSYCSLYVNNILNQTYTLVGNNSYPIFYLLNLTNGTYDWNVECNDGSLSGYSENWTFIVNASQTPINNTIYLNSIENNSATSSLGIIEFNFAVNYTLPNQTSAPNGVYFVQFAAPSGYAFSYWVTTPGLTITSPTSNPTTVFVSGSGNLTAVYYNLTGGGTNQTNATYSAIVVNEFESNPLSGSEWVELYNNNSFAVNISGWQIWDGLASPSLIHTVPAGTFLAADAYYVANVTGLNNGGEFITLYALGSTLVDNTSTLADSSANNSCWARVPNGIDTNTSADWTFQLCTQGATNNLNITNVTNTTNAVPVVNLIDPLNGAVINNTQNIQFNYTFTDDNSTASCDIYLDGILNQTNPSVLNNTFASFAISNIPFGTHLWNVSCSDGTNTGWSATWMFTLVNTSSNITDTIPPTITFIPPTPANNSIINQNYFFANTSIVDNVAVVSALLEFNGVVNNTMSGSGTNWYYNVTGLPVGTYTYKVYANDPSGNWGASETRTITINQSSIVNNAPTVLLNTPINGTTILNNPLITFNFTAIDDLSSTLSCAYYIDGVFVGSNSSVINGTLSSFISNVTYGNHSWYVSCADGFTSNVSQTWLFSIVDTIPPALAIISPISTTYLVSNILVNISATDVNLDRVWYNVNNGANISYTSPNIQTFADGSYTLTAFANDTFGNIATASVSFVVNTSGVVQGYVYDVDNRIWNATVQLKQGTATIAQTYTDVDGNYTFTVPAGSYNISVLKSGYNPANVGTIITVGGTTTSNILLTPASGSGAVSGTVYDFPGFSTIPNATVYIKISGTNTIVQIVKSKAAGYYKINGLVTTNSYDLWANMPPTYNSSYLNQTGVFVPAGGTATAKDLVIS